MNFDTCNVDVHLTLNSTILNINDLSFYKRLVFELKNHLTLNFHGFRSANSELFVLPISIQNFRSPLIHVPATVNRAFVFAGDRLENRQETDCP